MCHNPPLKDQGPLQKKKQKENDSKAVDKYRETFGHRRAASQELIRQNIYKSKID